MLETFLAELTELIVQQVKSSACVCALTRVVAQIITAMSRTNLLINSDHKPKLGQSDLVCWLYRLTIRPSGQLSMTAHGLMMINSSSSSSSVEV